MHTIFPLLSATAISVAFITSLSNTPGSNDKVQMFEVAMPSSIQAGISHPFLETLNAKLPKAHLDAFLNWAVTVPGAETKVLKLLGEIRDRPIQMLVPDEVTRLLKNHDERLASQESLTTKEFQEALSVLRSVIRQPGSKDDEDAAAIRIHGPLFQPQPVVFNSPVMKNTSPPKRHMLLWVPNGHHRGIEFTEQGTTMRISFSAFQTEIGNGIKKATGILGPSIMEDGQLKKLDKNSMLVGEYTALTINGFTYTLRLESILSIDAFLWRSVDRLAVFSLESSP